MNDKNEKRQSKNLGGLSIRSQFCTVHTLAYWPSSRVLHPSPSHNPILSARHCNLSNNLAVQLWIAVYSAMHRF